MTAAPTAHLSKWCKSQDPNQHLWCHNRDGDETHCKCPCHAKRQRESDLLALTRLVGKYPAEAGTALGRRWLPIATAPQDGTLLWLVEDGEPSGFEIEHQYVGYWARSHRYEAGGFWQHAYRDLIGQPTHWMPKPVPPLAYAQKKR